MDTINYEGVEYVARYYHYFRVCGGLKEVASGLGGLSRDHRIFRAPIGLHWSTLNDVMTTDVLSVCIGRFNRLGVRLVNLHTYPDFLEDKPSLKEELPLI